MKTLDAQTATSPSRRMTSGPARPSIMVVTPWVYHPYCGNGGGVQCFQLLQRLREHYDIHFLSFAVASNMSEAGEAALREVCASVTFVAPPKRIPYWRAALLQTTRGIPKDALGLRSSEMADAIRTLRAALNPCVVMFQFPHIAQYLDVLTDVPLIMDTQDVHTISKFREMRSARQPVQKLKRFLSWIAWSTFELRYYPRASALLAISPNDQGVLQSLLPQVPTHLVPVAAQPHVVREDVAGNHVAFVGNFDHPPNRDAARWLLQEVWPRVQASHPEARLEIAGPNFPAELLPMADRSVRVLGFVEDLDQLLGSARAVLVPYQFGGGIKIKALDALARGCPVVATSIGAEGLNLSHGAQALIADDASSFAAAISQLWGSSALRKQLGAAARAHIAENFSWEVKVQRLLAAIQLLAAPGASSTTFA